MNSTNGIINNKRRGGYPKYTSIYFRPEIAYDEDGEAYIPMSPGNIIYGLFIIFIAVAGTAVVLLAAHYNSIMWVFNCVKSQREAEKKKTYLSY